MLLDEHSRSAALLKSLLFVVASELALDQDGRLSHLLIECKLLVFPVTALDHSCCYLLLLLEPPALRGEKEVLVPNCPPNRHVTCPSNLPGVL